MKRTFVVALLYAMTSGLKAQTNTFPANGPVGIGTINPTIPLTIYSNANNNTVNEALRITNFYSPSGNNNPAILFTNYDYGGDPLVTTGQSWALSAVVAGGESFSIIHKGGSGTQITPFFINGANGNIGIGTTNPVEKLDVAGEPVFGSLVERLSMGSASLAFNRKVANGTIYDNTRFAYQFQHSPSSNPAYDVLGLQVYNPSGSNVTPYALSVNGSAQVGINTYNIPAGYQFAVNGNAIANSITVKMYPWSDYVFNSDYKLPDLAQVKAYINHNHHLPEIPSEAEVAEKGLDLGEINKLLLKKVEELTLYLIEKDVKDLQNRLTKLENK